MRHTRKILLWLLLASFGLVASGQSEKINHRVFLLGNLCDTGNDPQFLNHLELTFKNITEPYTLLLTGDLTNAALDSKIGEMQIGKVKSLIRIVEKTPQGKIILWAGDRDWKKSKRGGQKRFNELEKTLTKFIKDENFQRTEWADKKGCPGPRTFELSESLLLIVANSQWWNHPYDKPRPEDGLCTVISDEDFAEELESEVKENLDKNIIIAAHHPFESLGNYGGFFSVGSHLTPIPIAGSFKTAFRKNIGTSNDISNEHLLEYREEMRNLFFFYKNLVFVSGHEKNQQIIRDGDNYLINSGAPIKGKFAAQHEDALVSNSTPGMIALNYFDSGKVEADFLKKETTGYKDLSKYTLFESSCLDKGKVNPQIPLNDALMPCVEKIEATEKMNGTYSNQSMIAGKEYKAGFWRKIWLGNHYRTTWTHPINVPALNLDTTYGGLTIYKKGGGRQTTSLKFKAADGTQYTFRSVNKDPSKAFNYKLRPTFITPLFRDQTSTQHPFGAMVVAPLLDELGILHASPTLYYLPDDPKLGIFQKKYGNLLGMLEDNPSKPNDKGEVFGGAEKIYQSNKLYKKLYATKKNRVDEKEFIKARIFDILIGDWSKHEDNWKWAAFPDPDGNGTLFRPIPRDRDHAFSRQDGVIPWLANRSWAIKNIETFEHKLRGLRSLMYQAIHMDRFLTTSPDREDWIAAAKEIQSQISAADIDRAVQNLPPEVMDVSGKTIASKLKARLKDLDKYAEGYYKMLAEFVDVVGSNEKEYFEITRDNNGTVAVKIFNQKKKAKGKHLFYQRTFIPKETKEIRIYGLGGDDIFDIQGEGKSSILIRILGNSGDDLFKDETKKSKTRTLIYDKGKGSQFEVDDGSKVVKHWNKEIYEYDRLAFDYHRTTPIFGLSYNGFNGLSLTLGTSLLRQKFGKKNYSSMHSFLASASTKKNVRLNYTARFHHAVRNWDIPFEIDFSSPEFRNNFYGLGNNTVFDQDLFDDDFYQFFHKTFHVKSGLGKTFWQKSTLDFMVGFERSSFKDLPNTILENNTDLFGANTTILEIPLEASALIDFRDQAGFPYDGILWQMDYRFGTIIDGAPETATYGVASSALEYFISSKNKNPVTLGLRIGGAISHGQVPFYHLPNIGGATGLRGYTGERFTGESSMYFNSELRWQLFQKYTPFVPIKFGLKAFYDTGRVNLGKSELNGNKWHAGYGFGVFIVPLYEAVSISLAVGFSEEESFYPVISFGRAL